MMAASHASLSPCGKLDEGSPKFLEDRVQSNDPPIPNINFDCSICLELPHDPVVTMCGHLFCWPCLHRWITSQPIFQECPVCKACVKDKVIPLYGRGRVGFVSTDTKMDHSFDIPRPPSAQQSYVPAVNAPQSTRYHHQSDHYQSVISQETHGYRGGHSTYSMTASGLFPALFGIHMITSPGGTSFNAQPRMLAVGGHGTVQQQRRNAQQESVLYWFLFLLGCFASVCFLLF